MAQVVANEAAVFVEQGLGIAEGLRLDEDVEAHGGGFCPGFVGDGGVLLGVGEELDEEAVAAVAFVQLAGGVEEAGAVADGGSQFGLLADVLAQGV